MAEVSVVKFTVEMGLRKYGAYILSQCLLRTGNRDDAEDLRADVFEKIWATNTFNGKEDDFRKWIAVVVKNQHTDGVRRANALKRQHYQSDVNEARHLCSAEDTQHQIEQKELLKSVLYAVEHSPLFRTEYFRETFELRFLEEKTYKEIAADLGLNWKKVKKIVNEVNIFVRNKENFKIAPASSYEYNRVHTQRTTAPIVYGVRSGTQQIFFDFAMQKP